MLTFQNSLHIFSSIQDNRTEEMKGKTDEPIYAEANNNFSKEVSDLGTTLVSGLRTTLYI